LDRRSHRGQGATVMLQKECRINLSIDPSKARWIMTGRLFVPSRPVYSNSKRSGIEKSSCTVPHCQLLFKQSLI